MKYPATMALLFSLAIPSIYAHEEQVKRTFSGTEGASAINLDIPGTRTGKFDFAGSGNLAPQQSSACPTGQVYVATLAGAAVFRFEDGSLLKLKLTEGFDCIDFVALAAVFRYQRGATQI